MEFEPNYGSSEYSSRAEQLFAGFLLDAEAGADQDFEEFCAEHAACADELYGLHADWDNVRGLLAQLEGQRAVRAPQPQQPTRQPAPTPEVAELARRRAALEPFSAKDVPEREFDGSPAPAWRVLGSLGFLVALISCIWAAQLTRNTHVLAQETQDLRAAGDDVRSQLEVERDRGLAQAQNEQRLASELETSQRVLNEIRAGLEQQQANQRALQSKRAELDERLARERAEHERALGQARSRGNALALRLESEQLIANEAALWPATADNQAALEDWVRAAQALLARWQDDRLAQASAAESPQQTPTRSELERLTRRAQQQQRALQLWSEALAESPLYADLPLTPQWGLMPLGPGEGSGLWRFADWQTATDLAADRPSGALEFVLIPALELEGHRIEAFLISTDPRSGRRADLDNPLQAQVEYELDLLRLGYGVASKLQLALAQQHGLDVASWKRYPVRALRR